MRNDKKHQLLKQVGCIRAEIRSPLEREWRLNWLCCCVLHFSRQHVFGIHQFAATVSKFMHIYLNDFRQWTLCKWCNFYGVSFLHFFVCNFNENFSASVAFECKNCTPLKALQQRPEGSARLGLNKKSAVRNFCMFFFGGDDTS